MKKLKKQSLLLLLALGLFAFGDPYKHVGDVENLGRDLRHGRVRALSHIDGAAINDAAAVRIDADDGAGRCR